MTIGELVHIIPNGSKFSRSTPLLINKQPHFFSQGPYRSALILHNHKGIAAIGKKEISRYLHEKCKSNNDIDRLKSYIFKLFDN